MDIDPQNENQEEKVSIDKFYRIAKQICEGRAGGDYIYCLEEDKFYQYKQGYWQHIYTTEMIKNISQYCLEDGREKYYISKFPLSVRNNIIENVKVINDLHLSCFNQAPLINLENYMFDPVGINIINHNKDFFSTVRIPYKYDRALGCPLWVKTLNEILEGDKQRISLLQEFFGYCLTRDTKQHKALLLLGESRSGKSTILKVLREMVGGNNCSSVPLKFISNPQYTPMLINKLVNMDTDVSSKAAEFEAEFKTITSGEPVSCNQKFVPAFEFIPFCKIVMAANIFPRITDHSSAFYKRLLLIPCDRVFSEDEQNKNLPDELRNELPGILNWSIEGLKRLIKRGRFEEFEFMREAVQELEDTNNPLNVFLDEHIEVEDGYSIEKGDLFNKYIQWAQETKNYPLTAARFSAAFFKKYHKFTPKNGQDRDTHRRVWKNIKYVHFKSYKEEIELPAEIVNPHTHKAIEVESKQGDIDWEA